MSGRPITPSPTPWESLGSVLGFPDDDQKFWWKTTAPVLGKLLKKANYTVDQQYFYLSRYHRYILSAYGPCPEEGKERTWRAQCTPNASPFQPSWNFQNDKSTIRFTIEPIGSLAGTRTDPFNQLAAFELVKTLTREFPDMEESWFYHCAREYVFPQYEKIAVVMNNSNTNCIDFSRTNLATYRLYVPKDLVNIMLAVKGPPKGPKPPTCFLAFDLDDGKIEPKAYFFPHIRAWNMGITQGALVINTVRGLNGPTINMNAGLDNLETYLTSGGPVTHRNVEMLAIDCIDPLKARAKIYVNSYNNTFNKIKDIYTMGGRLQDPAILDSLAPLAELWRLMYDMPDEGWEDIELPNVMHHRSCFVFGFEFKTGDVWPTTKIYFPMWHYAKNDRQITDALSAFYAKQGWNEISKSYAGDIEEIL